MAATKPRARRTPKPFARLTVPVTTPSMEARLVGELPPDAGWQFEPKWDGFRCLAFRDGDAVALRARSGKSLTRYFPEMVTELRGLGAQRFVLDGELAIPLRDSLAFDALQLRLHPAASRIRKLAAETPAIYILFDLLMTETVESLLRAPLSHRRAALEAFYRAEKAAMRLRLSPITRDRATAETWLARAGGAVDGVVAKRLDGAYVPGERAMLKVKQQHTADCVVGGFRYLQRRRAVGSLLLGLYRADGRLDHVGFSATITNEEREKLTRRLEALISPPGFTGNAPGSPSRWSSGRSAEWQPLRPKLVVEVRYDQVTGDRFRHGVTLLRWRPDKAPRQCTFDQLHQELRPAKLIADLADA